MKTIYVVAKKKQVFWDEWEYSVPCAFIYETSAREFAAKANDSSKSSVYSVHKVDLHKH